ncbi:MAG: glycogen synthase [Chthoniobacterales bacterium]
MRILMISAEGPPLARATALVDVLEALPGELRARGHEVGLVLPFYREIRENMLVEARNAGVTADVQVGTKTYVVEFLEGRTAGGVQLFFVRCDEFFDRTGVYGEGGKLYEDNAARFILFSKAAVELARRLNPSPQVLHVHDWAAALVPVLVHENRLPFKTVLTIHHVAEQGSFWGLDFSLTNLPERYFTPSSLEFFGRMNLLKGGIVFADALITVSQHYKHEILTTAAGGGLEVVLREHAHRLSVIGNGADYRRWDPANDKFLPMTYAADRLLGKDVCRDLLVRALNLAPAPRGPVFGMVTRLVPEKGFDDLIPILDRLLSEDVRLIILGEGDPAYATALSMADRKHANRFAYSPAYDESLAHLIEAGADVTLIPSRVEPSGLSAMYSLKYGALPVARAIGGIQEIIEDYDPSADTGHGFLYYERSSEALWDAVKRALEVFEDRPVWNRLVERAMAQDFSWSTAAKHYEQIYGSLLPMAQQIA